MIPWTLKGTLLGARKPRASGDDPMFPERETVMNR